MQMTSLFVRYIFYLRLIFLFGILHFKLSKWVILVVQFWGRNLEIRKLVKTVKPKLIFLNLVLFASVYDLYGFVTDDGDGLWEYIHLNNMVCRCLYMGALLSVCVVVLVCFEYVFKLYCGAFNSNFIHQGCKWVFINCILCW